MKNTFLLALVALCSCIGMVISYGSVAVNNAGFGGFGYFPAYHSSSSNLGMFGSSGGAGLFETLIQSK